MLASRITPKVVASGLALHLAVWVGLHLPALAGGPAHFRVTEGALKTGTSILAYAVAVALNLGIAAEYRHAPWLRVAWLALAANAAVSIFRTLAESTLVNLAWAGYTRSPLFGVLQQSAIVSANSFLLVGVLAMWWAYHRAGLGFSVGRRDYAAMGGILALMLAILALRENLSLAGSPYLAVRHVQQAGMVLLLATSAASVVLYRLARQMGGGKLAAALRCLTLYAVLRGLFVFLGMLQQMLPAAATGPRRLSGLFLDLAWQLVPWVATLAAAYRADLTASAARELECRRAGRAALASA